ncbi:MAG: SDR family NAD(P)-dependent oxidoreductase [Deltaproteobacteria bacterium]|nr:SDR family NAD(P)-dependent oxidoreductase [Deltaproteobacteria bacterium]
MKKLRDRVAVITGAASGIGRALAIELATEGAHVALCDVDEEGLEATRERAASHGVRATSARIDVADRDAVHGWAEQVEGDHGGAHLVINNAGVGLAASLRRVSYEDFEWLMGINFWGVVHGTRAFLPILERQDEGHIVNISSVFGIIAAPLNGTYNAAKFAVKGYTEALRMELKLDGLPIGVTCVHPGGIKTNIARSARVQEGDLVMEREDMAQYFEDHCQTTPTECARQILKGVRRNAPRVLVGFDARVVDVLQRLAPTAYQHLARRQAKAQWRSR